MVMKIVTVRIAYLVVPIQAAPTALVVGGVVNALIVRIAGVATIVPTVPTVKAARTAPAVKTATD